MGNFYSITASRFNHFMDNNNHHEIKCLNHPQKKSKKILGGIQTYKNQPSNNKKSSFMARVKPRLEGLCIININSIKIPMFLGEKKSQKSLYSTSKIKEKEKIRNKEQF